MMIMILRNNKRKIWVLKKEKVVKNYHKKMRRRKISTSMTGKEWREEVKSQAVTTLIMRMTAQMKMMMTMIEMAVS